MSSNPLQLTSVSSSRIGRLEEQETVASDSPLGICSESLPAPLRLFPKDTEAQGRIESIKRRLTESNREQDLQRTLQHLHGVCYHNIRAWRRSTVGQIVQRFETSDSPDNTPQITRLPDSGTPNHINSFIASNHSQSDRQNLLEESTSSHCNTSRQFHTIEIQPSDTTPIVLFVSTTGTLKISSNELTVSMADARRATESNATPGPKQRMSLRRNMLGPSNPLIAKPESSTINAEGKIQGLERKSTQDASKKDDSVATSDVDPATISTESYTSADAEVDETSDKTITDDDELEVMSPRVMAVDEPVGTTGSDAMDGTGDKTNVPPNNAPLEIASSPPDIMVHSTSNPASNIQSLTVGALAIASVSSVHIPSAPCSSPALTASAANAFSDNPISTHDIAGIQTKMTDATSSVGAPQVLNETLAEVPKPTVPQLESVPTNVSVKLEKREKLRSKGRKLVLRRPVLVVLLGRELGNITHAGLHQVQAVAGAAPVAVPL